jgi:hypothetical protein
LFVGAYMSAHWLAMAASVMAYNILPQKPSAAAKWTNRDWSAALWAFVHLVAVASNVVLYDHVSGKQALGAFC